MESHGGGVEVLSLEDDVLRLRLHGSRDGCPASASTLELAIKQELEEAAPDLLGIEVEGPVEQPRTFSGSGAAARLGRERLVAARAGVDDGRLRCSRGRRGDAGDGEWDAVADRERRRLLLAYRDACAACRSPLVHGALEGGILTCPSRERFALPLAGRVSSAAPSRCS